MTAPGLACAGMATCGAAQSLRDFLHGKLVSGKLEGFAVPMTAMLESLSDEHADIIDSDHLKTGFRP